jgi:hypothetical protein
VYETERAIRWGPILSHWACHTRLFIVGCAFMAANCQVRATGCFVGGERQVGPAVRLRGTLAMNSQNEFGSTKACSMTLVPR